MCRFLGFHIGADDVFVLLTYGAAYWVIGAQHFKAAYCPHLQWLKCPVSLDILTLDIETPW